MSSAERPINPIHVRWLEKRAIDPEQALAMGLYSAKAAPFGAKDREPIPDVGGNILAFPYFEAAREINAKFRAPGKRFFQREGCRKTFYNSDVIDDPALAAGTVALVITEGEPDAIVSIQCGHPHTVSCPDGAPPDRDSQGRPIPMRPDDEIDPANDSKFEFYFNNKLRLAPIKRIILATDGDGPGMRLRDELARRIGRVRCLFVEYPFQDQKVVDTEDRNGKKIKRAVKDLNEVRMHFGDDAVRDMIRNARPYPVKGLYHLCQYPELPPIPTFTTGWWSLDRNLRLFAGEFMVVTGIPSHGKALALDTLVPTPSGWTTMGELSVGDSVYAGNGEICTIVRCSDVMHGRPCHKIKFDDGLEIVADADHQWFTTSERARRSARMAKKKGRDIERSLKLRGTDQTHKRAYPSIITTAEIGREITSSGKNNHQIQLTGRVEGLPTVLPIDPYILGAWLGDGTSANGSITIFESEILQRIASNGSQVKAWAARGRYNVEELKPKLRILGLLMNKHIPAVYLRAPVQARIYLLQGLMDTDGTCGRRDRVCEYTSINKALAQGVYELVSSLGIKATLIEGNATLYGRIISRKYRVCFIADFPVFSLQRKIANQRIGDQRRTKARIIVACDRVQSVPVRCIQVDAPSHLFLVSKGFIPTHNSTWVLNLVVNLAESHGWRSAIFSPEMPTVPHLRDKLRRIRLRKKPLELDWEELAAADQWINDNMVFIDADPSGEPDDDEFDLDWILERAADAVRRDGVRILVIDPWNEIEHARYKSESTTEYIGRSIRALKRFAQLFGVAVIVVAHPTKDVAKDGKNRAPSLYDIDGSAHFFNKCDHGVIIDRPNAERDESDIRIAKVRFEESGDKGMIKMSFNRESSRFEVLDNSAPPEKDALCS